MIYNYDKEVKMDLLRQEIEQSSIVTALDYITQNGTDLSIAFKANLSEGDENTLDTLVVNHDKDGFFAFDPQEVKLDTQADGSGRYFFRNAITEAGWSYLAHFIEMESSKLNSVKCYDHNNVLETAHYCKFYNASNVELTTQEDIDLYCVKSVFTIKPGIDYEIVCGEVHHSQRPTENFRVNSVIGVIDNNGNQIAIKPFVRNMNLKFFHEAKNVQTDGRAPKLLAKEYGGLPWDANQIQLIAYHPAGFKHEFCVELEYYRE